MVLCALFAALTAVCAWLSIPLGGLALTMQTFAVFLTLRLLGGKWGTASIGLYLALGAVGMPVFSGFQGGIGALLGVTGGYLWGFLLAGLIYWALEKLSCRAGMVLGLAACYLCGTLWFGFWAGTAGIWVALLRCVVPYVLPDLGKLALADALGRRLKRAYRFCK